MNEILSTDRAPAAIGPYSQGVRTGNILFLSGQLGLDPASGTLPEGVKAQSEQAFAALLEAAGMTFANVVKVTIFITDLDYFSTVNDAMIAAFDGLPYPARSCVVVADLPKHGLVEVEAVAAL
jgi:2-iminobutanoate/2-iminopropanoate deaminase